MDIQATKIELASFILELQNPELVEKIKNLIYRNTDFYEELSDDQKASIKLGMQQAQNGQTRNWEEVKTMLDPC
jgi:predicted transcriptional regulator